MWKVVEQSASGKVLFDGEFSDYSKALDTYNGLKLRSADTVVSLSKKLDNRKLVV